MTRPSSLPQLFDDFVPQPGCLMVLQSSWAGQIGLPRRTLLAGAAASAFTRALSAASGGRRPHVLLRSSWQTVNIGDIAHTPGLLRILQTHLPDVEVTLWPSRVDHGVDELLTTRFPKLRIVRSEADREQAFGDCDFLLHGSGPSLVAQRDVQRWSRQTGKPYGVYAITLPPKKSSATRATPAEAMAATIDVLSDARFVYFRDTVSLKLARSLGCSSPEMGFAPDAAFACDLRDEQRAERFLEQHGLTAGNYLCCIPRLRYTPDWRIKDRPLDPVKHARNREMREHDHAPLRQAIIEVARTTPLSVMLCPEDQTQMLVAKELLLDPLPVDVRQRVVWRSRYWLTGEAISTYRRSAGLFGNELHSAIMCIGHGVPAIVCRWAEQTSKGLMWRDIGLDDWLFDLDRPEQVERVVPAVLRLARDPEAARSKAIAARAHVERRQAETMAALGRALAAGGA